MDANTKTIQNWFSMIGQGQVVLPIFQRHEAWSSAQVVGLLENILREPSLPIGALLTLDVGDEEPFRSRPIVGAPEPKGKPMMHLLDGQQRLTALWRSLNGNYPNVDFFVSMKERATTGEEGEEDDSTNTDAPRIEAIKRWDRKGVMQPVWANSPVVAYRERGLIPLTVLCPGSDGEKALRAWDDAVEWDDAAEENTFDSKQDYKDTKHRVDGLRLRVASYSIPYLSLDAGTGRTTALDVFIKMNTSASPLKAFDIVVAQLHGASGDSLHDIVKDIVANVPGAKNYGRIEDIILSVAALLMKQAPIKKTYLHRNYGKKFPDIEERLRKGVKQGIAFLRSEGILNEKCLPSDAAVYLLCALWADMPEDGFDAGGNARTLLRKVLWRTCYTDRYGKTSATRAFADYKVLRKVLAGGKASSCDLFDEKAHPLPVPDQLIQAGWPGRKDRLPRAILSTALRRGARDFADDAKITAETFFSREYHHLYPIGFLGEQGKDGHVNKALNCALITWKTNRKISKKAPSEYIRDRIEAADLGETNVKKRLESQRIPYSALVKDDYDAFLRQRAKLIHADMTALCDGAEP